MFEFAGDFQKKHGKKLESVAILHEDSLWGSDSGSVQKKMATDQGYKVVEDIAYKAKTTSLTSEVATPEGIESGYAASIILYFGCSFSSCVRQRNSTTIRPFSLRRTPVTPIRVSLKPWVRILTALSHARHSIPIWPKKSR